MQIHELKRNIKNKKKITIGRGGKRGKTSGRGTKGQNARAGNKKRPEMRDIIKKIPKLRGYRFTSIVTKPVTIPLGEIGRVFTKGGDVTPQILFNNDIIKKEGGFYPRIKILGDGEITSAIIVSGCEVSASAEEKIKKAGGSVAKPPVIETKVPTITEAKTETVTKSSPPQKVTPASPKKKPTKPKA